ncbi:MAG: TIGR02147 family protein [Pseudobdellovibrio sp.]
MSYRFSQILNDELKKRQQKNKSYSLRAFARDLKISQATASLLLRGKAGLSRKKAQAVGAAIGLKGEDLNYFVDLTIADCAKSPASRRDAAMRLVQYDSRFNSISPDFYKILSSWYMVPIMELIRIYNNKATPNFLATRLDISVAKVKNAIEVLSDLKIVEGTKILTDFMVMPNAYTQKDILQFYHDILDKADWSMKHGKKGEKNISTAILRMRKSDMEWASKELREFRRKLAKRLEEGDGHDAVYALSTLFFRLDRDNV